MRWSKMKNKIIFLFFFLIFHVSSVSALSTAQLESEPEVMFQFDKLEKSKNNLALQVEFNKAVLFLEKGEYLSAIEILKKTQKYIKIPSFLNIGIAYYKLESYHNARIYLNRIYEFENAMNTNTYSYMSACYYLYKITKNKKYLEQIISIASEHKKLTEHSKRLISDTLIILKKYSQALKVMETMDFPQELKRALLYIKIKKYSKAEQSLLKAYEIELNPKKIDEIRWFMIYRDLKSNQIEKLLKHLDALKSRTNFKINQELPLQIYFNKYKYTPKEYIHLVTKFSLDRQIDFLFYFAPYVFSDNEEIIYDMSKGFIFQEEKNVESLKSMVKYNANFLDFLKKDPIIRVKELEKLAKKKDTKSYIYYNLGICYAQINDYHSALKYFERAYKLNPGNKLFSAMTLISAKKINKRLSDKAYIEANLRSNKGLFKYFGHSLYHLFLNDKYEVHDKPSVYKSTIFYKSLDFLEQMNAGKKLNGHPLLKEYDKDPLIYLINLVLKKNNESTFSYYSRLQDSIPLVYNNNFLGGPVLITQYYFDILKGLGLFFKADLELEGNLSPSYLRTQALIDLHFDKANRSVKVLEKLQNKYNLEDKYTSYLIVAGLLEAKKYNEASVQISLIKALLNDRGANFLTGVQLVQELKFSSADQYFVGPYTDSLIDFMLVGFDDYLESL